MFQQDQQLFQQFQQLFQQIRHKKFKHRLGYIFRVIDIKKNIMESRIDALKLR
jgi:hypothetical protein